MKKMTSVIAIILLFALLLTGCDFIPLPQDFSQYGFKFTIAGEVTEKEGNEFGKASFTTKYGETSFEKQFSATVTELLLMGAKYKEPFNGGTLYTFEANDGIINTYYLIEIADGSSWLISFATPEADYNKDSITNVIKSVEFVTAA